MFGEFKRQAGDSPEQVNWEGWTPPWMSREGRGPRGPVDDRRSDFRIACFAQLRA